MSRWGVGIAALVVVGVSAVGVALWRADPGRTAGESPGTQLPAGGNTALTPVADSGADKPAAPPALMYVTGVKLETGGAAPQACIVFSRGLSHAPMVHYEDYIRIDPAAKVSLQADTNRLCIGGLAFEKHYTVTVAQGLPDDGSAVTLAPETLPVSFGEMPPHVGFADSGFILSRDQVRGMPIETVNVDKVKVTVSRVGDRILARTELGKSWQDSGQEYEIAAPVWTGELAVKKRLNEQVVTGFPIADVLTPRKPGAYVVRIERVRAPGESLERNTEYYDPLQNQRWDLRHRSDVDQLFRAGRPACLRAFAEDRQAGRRRRRVADRNGQ